MSFSFLLALEQVAEQALRKIVAGAFGLSQKRAEDIDILRIIPRQERGGLGDRTAQVVIQPLPPFLLIPVSRIDRSDRGSP